MDCGVHPRPRIWWFLTPSPRTGSGEKAGYLKAASISKLDNTVNNNSVFNVSWILYKMISAVSFSQPYLCKQPPHNLHQNSVPPIPAIFYLPILPFIFRKIILTIPTNTLFLYTSVIFHLPFFAHNQPYSLHQTYFPYLSHLSNSDCDKGPMSKGVLWGLTLY